MTSSRSIDGQLQILGSHCARRQGRLTSDQLTRGKRRDRPHRASLAYTPGRHFLNRPSFLILGQVGACCDIEIGKQLASGCGSGLDAACGNDPRSEIAVQKGVANNPVGSE